MLQITPQMRILLAVTPADFRKGIDGLARLCQDALRGDPFSGTAFVFRNRAGTSVKVLVYDGQGFWLAQKRLSEGRFRWWPPGRGEQSAPLDAHELQVLLYHSGAPSSLPAKMLCQSGTGGPGGASPLMEESNSPAEPTIEPLGSGSAGLWNGDPGGARAAPMWRRVGMGRRDEKVENS